MDDEQLRCLRRPLPGGLRGGRPCKVWRALLWSQVRLAERGSRAPAHVRVRPLLTASGVSSSMAEFRRRALARAGRFARWRL